MTRVTNFGRKRTYLQAGFGNNTHEESTAQPREREGDTAVGKTIGEDPGVMVPTDEPPKKKRKRIRKKKQNVNEKEPVADSEGKTTGEGDDNDEKSGINPTTNAGPSKKALKRKKWKEAEKTKKQRTTTCFSCHEKGHVAKNCPNSKDEVGSEGSEQEKGDGRICFRCGSTRHTLPKCRKVADKSNPFPFASCFVCNNQGHLASECPENKDKRIHPDGGRCKLCGDKTHLAKDCDLLRKDNIGTLGIIGTGQGPGADEDDFHSLGRRKQEVEKETKIDIAKKKQLHVKAGANSGIVKSFALAPKPTKKVVFF